MVEIRAEKSSFHVVGKCYTIFVMLQHLQNNMTWNDLLTS